jgi:hypothetical protein
MEAALTKAARCRYKLRGHIFSASQRVKYCL